MKFNPVSIENKWFLLEIPIFHYRVFLFVGTKEKMYDTVTDGMKELNQGEDAEHISNFVQNWVDGNHLKGTNGDCFGFDGVGIIRVDKLTTGNLQHLLVLNHECLHVAGHILEFCNILESQNNECLCYTHEYVFGELLKKTMAFKIKKGKGETQT